VHKKSTGYKGYKHQASADDPRYEIKSDKTDYVAMHEGGAAQSRVTDVTLSGLSSAHNDLDDRSLHAPDQGV